MLLTGKKIAIIGGGPGGLTLARLLQLKGANVHVYERDANASIRQQGSTLDLHQDGGLKALEAAQLMDAFTANYRPDAGKLRIADKRLRIFFDDHATPEGYLENRPEIDRGPLRDLLIDSLAPDTVIWDRQFVSMEKMIGKAGWQLVFHNGRTAEADIVVAADGANSRIRPYITAIQPVYSGITIIEGNVHQGATHAPVVWALTKGGKVFILDAEKSVATTAKGDGTLTFYAGLKVEEDWVKKCGIDFQNAEGVAAWFKQEFAGWDPAIFELVSSEHSIIPRVMYHYPVDQHWDALEDLTMLGDAAHRMPPYAGEGVNMAMLDAFKLAEALSSPLFSSVKDAIRFYEAEMLKRAAAITDMTLDNTRRLHGPDAIGQMQMVMQGQ